MNKTFERDAIFTDTKSTEDIHYKIASKVASGFVKSGTAPVIAESQTVSINKHGCEHVGIVVSSIERPVTNVDKSTRK